MSLYKNVMQTISKQISLLPLTLQEDIISENEPLIKKKLRHHLLEEMKDSIERDIPYIMHHLLMDIMLNTYNEKRYYELYDEYPPWVLNCCLTLAKDLIAKMRYIDFSQIENENRYYNEYPDSD